MMVTGIRPAGKLSAVNTDRPVGPGTCTVGSESALWDTVRRNMKGRWRAQRLEDKLALGIPDVCYAIKGQRGLGFVELKYQKAWPKRPTTPLRLKRYTQEQRLWLWHFGTWAEKCFLLLQVEREYFLFDWGAAQDVGELTREELHDTAMRVWFRSIDYDELTELLT